jgi:hypothetical protein
MTSQVETVSGQIGSGLLAKADRLFRNDDDSDWIELLQNARRAAATKVDITIEQPQAGVDCCVVTIQDNGGGIANFQDLLTLGSSGWTTDTQAKEDNSRNGILCLVSFGC